MMFFAPPAPARPFVQQNPVEPSRALSLQFSNHVKIIIVIRRPDFGEIGKEGRVGLELNLPVFAKGHPVGERVFLTAQDALGQSGKHDFPFADHHVIDPRKRAEMFQAHLPVEIGPAEDDANRGIQLLDQFGQGQARHVLIEGGRESHDLELPPIVRGQHLGQKLWRDGVADLFQVPRGTPGLLRRALEHGLEHVGVPGVLRVVPKQNGREQPLADHAAFFAQHFVERETDTMGKEQVEVITPGPDAVVLQHPGQGAELNGREFGIPERHGDQGHPRDAVRIHPGFFRDRSTGLRSRLDRDKRFSHCPQRPGRPWPPGKNRFP